jgi:hypothetical protein
MRYVVRALLSGSCLAIGYWMFFFTARKQTLHDMISGTVVVRNVEETAPTIPLRPIDPGLAAHEDYWDGSQWIKRPIVPPGRR